MLARDAAADDAFVTGLNGKPNDPDALPPPKRLLDLDPAQPSDFAVDRFLVAGEPNGVVGDGDSFKTGTCLAISAAVASGAPAFGELLVKPGPVLYVSGEDTAD